jgi:hypothetical protein
MTTTTTNTTVKVKTFMNEGYCYIGRFIDHRGEFVTNYYKLGRSEDFKTRETRLNSTHMPIDVLFIRVFKTKHMVSLERALHACFEETRTTKEYSDRKSITTEWFEYLDEDLLHKKINKLTSSYPDTYELDLTSSILSDSGTTQSQKIEVLENINRVRSSVKIYIDNQELFGDTTIDRYVLFGKYLSDNFMPEVLLSKLPSYFKQTIDELPESMTNDPKKMNRNSFVQLDNGLFFVTWGNVKQRTGMIDNIKEALQISSLKYEVIVN